MLLVLPGAGLHDALQTIAVLSHREKTLDGKDVVTGDAIVKDSAAVDLEIVRSNRNVVCCPCCLFLARDKERTNY